MESGAEYLFQLYIKLVDRLKFIDPPVMFAGGLLTSETLLQQLLMKKIGLKDAPYPKYSPVAGAALMAQMSELICYKMKLNKNYCCSPVYYI